MTMAKSYERSRRASGVLACLAYRVLASQSFRPVPNVKV
jgi:hypothetical protein